MQHNMTTRLTPATGQDGTPQRAFPTVIGLRFDSAHSPAFAPPRARTAPLRVRIAGKLTSLAAPGGGEVQMQATAQALRDRGVDAQFWRPWEDDWRGFDCLHIFGSAPEHVETIALARRRGIKVVLSTIAWFDLASLWHEMRSFPRRLVACGKFAVRSTAPRLPSWRRRLYHAVDLLLPNSQAESQQLQRHFQAPAERIHIVPNGAKLSFASAKGDLFVQQFRLRDFVLYAGRIEPRKNQLEFLRAMHGAAVQIVILGGVVPGHEAYLAACRQAAGKNVHFLGRLDHDDPLLASAYAACGCMALTSWFETPGLVALEAAMTGTPLVLTRRGCTKEYFGPLASYASPGDPREIRASVLAALAQGRNPVLARVAQQTFCWEAAAAATEQAYEKAMAS